MTICNDVQSESTEVLVQDFTQAISSRGLEAVAILFLEMHKPLCGLLQAGVVPFLQPFSKPFGVELAQTKLMQILQDQDAVEDFICALERSAEQKKGNA